MRRGAFLFVLLVAGCVSAPEMPPDVRRESRRVEAGGESLSVDFYFRSGAVPRPLAVLVHGFLANKDRMAHWGFVLAREGFIVAVPTNPTYANDDRNTAAIVGLVKQGLAARWPAGTQTNGRVALIGFSRGGLETILAAAELGDLVDAWVGLDPVDRKGKGRLAAAKVRVPGLALLAEPEPLNARRNASAMLAAYAGPLRVMEIPGASHLDAESPRREGDFAGFEDAVVRFLRPTFGL